MNNIKLYRGLKGWTQTDLANAMDKTRTSVVIYESQKTNVKTMEEIAKLLGNCSTIEICGEDIFDVKPQNDIEIKQILKTLSDLAICPQLKLKLLTLSMEDCEKEC